MSGFGDEFCLTLITDDPALAARADRAGVDRVGLDLEVLGKAERQAGEDSRLSKHSLEDLATIAPALTRADLFARLNPVNPGTRDEVERAVRLGARVLMLPFFRTAREVETFVRVVDGRAHVTLLLETPPAVVRIREIVAVAGVQEVMIGLNDLRLAFGVNSHFEVMASPLLDSLAGEVRRAGLIFSVGGVARTDDGSLPIPPDLVLAQYPRLNATGAWVARSFFRGMPPDWDIAGAITSLRRRLTEWASATPEALERARRELAERART